MKSTLALKMTALACASALLGGCGQPGPLYLPKQPAKPAAAETQGKPGTPPPSAPVPSTPPASQQ